MVADLESRSLSINTEYELNHEYFKQICNTFGQTDIDLFATKLDTKCKHYISWYKDPDYLADDALTVDWKN